MKITKLIIITISILFITSCASNITSNNYEKIKYDTVIITNIDPRLINEKQYLVKVSNFQEFNHQINTLSIKKELVSIFDATTFEKKDLLLLAFPTSITPTYTLSRIEKKDNNVVIFIDKESSKDQDDTLTATCIIISMDKNQISDSDKIDIRFIKK